MLNTIIKKQFFNKSIKTLPTVNEFINLYGEEMFNRSYQFRQEYTKYLFPIITHELMIDLSIYVKNKKVCDLMAGTGWFAYWLSKYSKTKVDACDNHSWDNVFKRCLKNVNSVDVFDAMNKQYDMYILSWPYMDDNAYKIWNKMVKGQILIYIGEDYEGCCANNDFFVAVQDHELYQPTQKLNQHFKSFNLIHDEIRVFKK